MNSLIGLGAATSFLAGAASLLLPDVELQPSFLEEPVMLLAIVLLGRSLEARARLKASGGRLFTLRTRSIRRSAYGTVRVGLVMHCS
jgi:cation transport ATPase